MTYSKTSSEVFDTWAQDHRADSMATSHWPVVRQAFDLIPPTAGDYLEIGCGNGYGLQHMATHQFAQGHCRGLDASLQMAELARQRCRDLPNVHVDHGDFLAWDGRRDFSLIFSMEVFYYFPDIQAGLDKAYALLKPGGQLWVMVDFYEENHHTHNWPQKLDTPMQRWSMDDYRQGFARAGFEAVEQGQFVDPAHQPSAPDDQGTLCTVGTKTATADGRG